MIEEELPDELENDLDDIEPVGDESQLYEHFRVVVDKGQAMVRVDKYLFEQACGTGSTSGAWKLSRYACECTGMAHERYSRI